MITNRPAREIAPNDRISIQTDTFHEGVVTTRPERSVTVDRRVHFSLICEPEGGEQHEIELPEFRLVTVERNPS